MGRVAAVLFDMDDTLTDWPAAIDRAIEHVLPQVPAPHREGLRERMWPAVEEIAFVWRDGIVADRAYWKLVMTPEEVWQRVLSGVPAEEVHLIAQEFRQHVRPTLFDDVIPTLDALAGAFRLAVLSNNPYAARALERNGIVDRFEQVISAEDDYWKPHPRAFERACWLLEVPPGSTVYVGDSYDNDLIGASQAGLTAIWLDRVPFDYDHPAGSYRIETLHELPGLLERIERGGA